MSTPTKDTHNVAILLFSGADILDFCGPLEVLSNTTHNQDTSAPKYAFETTLVARTPTIPASGRGCLTITADTTFEEASKRIDDFDILVVPGGNMPLLLESAKSGGPEVDFVRAFNALPPKTGGGERIILSVCTGALLVAAGGVLKGMRATTHHLALELLKGVDASVEVVSTVGEDAVGRYVDCGRNAEGTRAVTAGGVSCGMDAALFVVELTVGRAQAEFAAEIMEYAWKRVGK